MCDSQQSPRTYDIRIQPVSASDQESTVHWYKLPTVLKNAWPLLWCRVLHKMAMNLRPVRFSPRSSSIPIMSTFLDDSTNCNFHVDILYGLSHMVILWIIFHKLYSKVGSSHNKVQLCTSAVKTSRYQDVFAPPSPLPRSCKQQTYHRHKTRLFQQKRFKVMP